MILWMKLRKAHTAVASPLAGEMAAKPPEGFIRRYALEVRASINLSVVLLAI